MYFFSLENSAHLLAYRHLSSAQNGEGGDTVNGYIYYIQYNIGT